METHGIRFRGTRDPGTQILVPTPRSIHAARRDARRTLVCLRTLQPALKRRALVRLRKSLRRLLDRTAACRNAHVQQQLVVKLKSTLSTSEASQCDELLAALQRRRKRETAKLAEYLHSDAGSAELGVLNVDLMALSRDSALGERSIRAARCYRRALSKIDHLLVHKMKNGHRLHRLRIRLRRTLDLAFLIDAPLDAGVERLNYKLNRIQDALGEVHDSMLFRQWVKTCGWTIPPALHSALKVWEEQRLGRCRRKRKHLRVCVSRMLG